jgi:DNA recombination protein RmuC
MSGIEILIVVVAAVALLGVAAALWLGRGSLRRLEDNVTRTQDSGASAADVAALRQAMDARLDSFTNLLANTTQSISQQLASAGDTIASVQQGVGEIRESSSRVIELGRDIKRLEELLRPPKARGAVGEILLENVFAQLLPPSQFHRQFPLAGSLVDFAVKIGDRYVPVDAKFPLESFERMINAPEEERPGLRRDFARAVKGKIDDIAAKYIRPDLGTYDFALMYLPSENIYYQTAVADSDLFEYGAGRRVFPVSPSTVYLYLVTVALGLQGMALEGKAAAVVVELRRLADELNKFQELFRVTGKHLRDAGNKYDEASRSLAGFRDRLAAAGQMRKEEGAEPLPGEEGPQLFGE